MCSESCEANLQFFSSINAFLAFGAPGKQGDYKIPLCDSAAWNFQSGERAHSKLEGRFCRLEPQLAEKLCFKQTWALIFLLRSVRLCFFLKLMWHERCFFPTFLRHLTCWMYETHKIQINKGIKCFSLLQLVLRANMLMQKSIYKWSSSKKNKHDEPLFWSNYSDLTRPHPKWWFSKGNHPISGKGSAVKYYNLARLFMNWQQKQRLVKSEWSQQFFIHTLHTDTHRYR